jgi:serine/threonine-protein phosphatase 2A regulatory subunit A
MVRRQAANNLAKFVKSMPASIVIEDMVPLFQHLAGDDQDSVRLLTVEVLIAIAEAVPKEQQSSHVASSQESVRGQELESEIHGGRSL